jgi:hypothetical protein
MNLLWSQEGFVSLSRPSAGIHAPRCHHDALGPAYMQTILNVADSQPYDCALQLFDNRLKEPKYLRFLTTTCRSDEKYHMSSHWRANFLMNELGNVLIWLVQVWIVVLTHSVF